MNPSLPRAAEPGKWLIVTLLSLGMVFAYVDRANISVVLALKDFRDAFHLGDMDRGLLNSAFFWSYAVLQIPAGWLVDKYGAKYPYAVGFAFWSFVSAATGFAQNIQQLAGARLLLGVGESVSTAASLQWIRFHCKEEERGLATGILFAGTKIGAAIGAPLTLYLVSRFDWRRMFLVTGGAGFIWLAAWLLSARNEDRPQQSKMKSAAAPGMSFAELLANQSMWGIILGTFAYNYFIYFSLTWMPSYFVEARNLSLNSMGFYTMFSFGGMAVVGIVAGWVADRLIARGGHPVRVRKAFTITGFIIASTEVLGALSHSKSAALFFAVFSLAGLGLATANYWAISQTIVPKSAIGRMIGIQNFASNSSGIVAPILTGWLKKTTGSYEAPMIAVLVVLVIGVTSYGLLVRETPISQQSLTPA